MYFFLKLKVASGGRTFIQGRKEIFSQKITFLKKTKRTRLIKEYSVSKVIVDFFKIDLKIFDSLLYINPFQSPDQPQPRSKSPCTHWYKCCNSYYLTWRFSFTVNQFLKFFFLFTIFFEREGKTIWKSLKILSFWRGFLFLTRYVSASDRSFLCVLI